MKTCRQNDEGFCRSCVANRRAEYELTGTDDPIKQKQYWNDVWEAVQQIRRAKFKRKLQGK